MDLVLSRSFGPFSQFYEVLRIVLGSVDSFEGIYGSNQTRGFGPFSQFYELLHIVLGSVDSFEGISDIYENSWIWSFLVVL